MSRMTAKHIAAGFENDALFVPEVWPRWAFVRDGTGFLNSVFQTKRRAINSNQTLDHGLSAFLWLDRIDRLTEVQEESMASLNPSNTRQNLSTISILRTQVSGDGKIS